MNHDIYDELEKFIKEQRKRPQPIEDMYTHCFRLQVDFQRQLNNLKYGQLPEDQPELFRDQLAHMLEELGELSKTDKRTRNFANSERVAYNDQKIEELADVIIVAMNLGMFSGFSSAEILSAVFKKVHKNRDRLNQKIAEDRCGHCKLECPDDKRNKGISVVTGCQAYESSNDSWRFKKCDECTHFAKSGIGGYCDRNLLDIPNGATGTCQYWTDQLDEEIQSPSEVFKKVVGENIAAGIQAGIEGFGKDLCLECLMDCAVKGPVTECEKFAPAHTQGDFQNLCDTCERPNDCSARTQEECDDYEFGWPGTMPPNSCLTCGWGTLSKGDCDLYCRKHNLNEFKCREKFVCDDWYDKDRKCINCNHRNAKRATCGLTGDKKDRGDWCEKHYYDGEEPTE